MKRAITILVLLLCLLLNGSLLAQSETETENTSNSAEEDVPTTEEFKSEVQEFFDEVLDVGIGWDALQIRHISNVGYGIDNTIGLNGDLRDTLEFARQVLQSELFVRSLLQYDHFWARTLNRNNYSPKEKEIERKFDEAFESNIKFEIRFIPAWDTVAMDADAARKEKVIAYFVQISTEAGGTIKQKIDQQQIEAIFQEVIANSTYSKISNEAKPAVNDAMFASIDNLKLQVNAVNNFDNNSIIEFTQKQKFFVPNDEANKLALDFKVNNPPNYNVSYAKLEIYKKAENGSAGELIYRSPQNIEMGEDITSLEWNGIINSGSDAGTVISLNMSPFVVRAVVSENNEFTGNRVHYKEYEASVNPDSEEIASILKEIFEGKLEELSDNQATTKEEIEDLLKEWTDELEQKDYFLPLFAGVDNIYITPGFSKYFTTSFEEGTNSVSRYAKAYNKDLEILPYVLQEDWIKKRQEEDELPSYVEEVLEYLMSGNINLLTASVDEESNEQNTIAENEETGVNEENTQEDENPNQLPSVEELIFNKVEGDILTYMEEQEIPDPDPIIDEAVISELPALQITGTIFNIQSNSITTQKAKITEINENIGSDKINVPGFKSIISKEINGKNYSNISVDLFFIDNQSIADLQLKENANYSSSENVLEKWTDNNYETANNKIALSYSSIIDNSGSFSANGLSISKDLDENQLPWLVAEYIQDQIMLPETDHITSLKKSINAFKNAFDQRFKEKLIEMGPKMMGFKYYYKGHTYLSHSYSYFKYTNEASRDALNFGLEKWTDNGTSGNVFDVYLKDMSDKKATLFDIVYGHSLVYWIDKNIYEINNFDKLYVKTGERIGRRLYTEYNLTFDKNTLFNLDNSELYETIDKIPEKSGTAKFIEEIKKSPVIIELKIDETAKRPKTKKYITKELINLNSLYKLYNGKLKGIDRNKLWQEQDVSEVTSEIGWSVGWSASYNQPTWCNVYASDLSRYIYGEVKNDDSPVPYCSGNCTANKQYELLNSNKKDYLDISSLKTDIWENYIDKGYPVYFSNSNDEGSGHIETGFPSGTNITISNKKYYYDEISNTGLDESSEYLSIGAGTYVGFKSYEEYSWFLPSATAFLYLGYLSFEYK